jgi:hypothetical protein
MLSLRGAGLTCSMLVSVGASGCATRQDESDGQAAKICRSEGPAGLEPLCPSLSVALPDEHIDCFGSATPACCEAFTQSIQDPEDYECFVLALRDREVGSLHLRVTYGCCLPNSHEVIAILGNEEAELTRVDQVSAQHPGTIDTARVRLRDPSFYDACLSAGMPDADPCLATQCVREWFEPGSCTDDLVCLDPVEYGDGGLLCP